MDEITLKESLEKLFYLHERSVVGLFEEKNQKLKNDPAWKPFIKLLLEIIESRPAIYIFSFVYSTF